jgi:sulfur-oxidizing protein SoxY
MNRRKFLGLGLGAAAAATLVPSSLSAVDFRATKPGAWAGKNSHTVESSMKELFGTSKTTVSKKIKLKAPAIAENGAVIPITVNAKKLNPKTIAVFQDANPESTVAVFTVPKNGIPEYSIRIKMAKTGKVTVVADVDGKLYSASATVKVTAGGCGG